MIIGIDMGASAVKLAALEGDEVVLTHYEHGRGGDIAALCGKLGLDLHAAEAVAVSGLSAGGAGLEPLGITPVNVGEAEAIGRGAVYLTGLDDVIVASIGNGHGLCPREGRRVHAPVRYRRRRGHAQRPGREGARHHKHARVRPHGHGREHEPRRSHHRRLCGDARPAGRRPHRLQPGAA